MLAATPTAQAQQSRPTQDPRKPEQQVILRPPPTLETQPAPSTRPAPQGPVPLNRIFIETRNVFSREEEEENVFYLIPNKVHVPTNPVVIRREMWFHPGDVITVEQVEELERNLRATGLFGAVDAALEEADSGADLRITSRDKFSLVLGAAAGFVGGVAKFNVTVAESNLLGTGKEVSATYRAAEEEHAAQVAYVDPQLLGTWHNLEVAGGETEEGPFGILNVVRPFKHLEDPVTYGIESLGIERDVDYFDRGDSVAQVPEERIQSRVFSAAGFGPRDLRGSLGGEFRTRHSDYEPATGRDAAKTRVPGDTLEFQVGPFGNLDYTHSYRKELRIDSINFVEDLRLGVFGAARFAVVHRDEDGRDSEFQWLTEVSAGTAFSPLPETYVTMLAAGYWRWRGGDTKGWSENASLHVYQQSLPSQTLAGSITFDAVGESQNLLPQFTLGEDNGLRGYPARQFSGTRRLVVNLEDRIYTGINFLKVHVGLAAFYDMGWIHSVGQSFAWDDAIRSVGIGLRFGSSNLLGAHVLRVDVAWPLDSVAGEDFNVSISASVGQVFSFFGNKSELRSEF